MTGFVDGLALGQIETQGLVGLIAATDAAVKAAQVDVRTLEKVWGGLVTVLVVGDVASVQVAVEVGAGEAARVGHLVSSHVIPRPDESIWRMFDRATPAVDEPESASSDETGADDLDATPVRELRRLARSLPNIGLSGREISRALKGELILAIRKARAAS